MTQQEQDGDVTTRLRDAMYEINDCWEHVDSNAAGAHIDDAIHHLKAALREVEEHE